jgi:hypothetical protein
VELYENDALRFRGRALFPADDWLSCRTITCEGERGFLRDGVIRPFLYQDTPAAIFAAALELYNAEVDDFKRFTLGTVTVTDPNDYVRLESESAMTFAAFFDKLVERCGGYITFNNDGQGGRAINWLAEIGTKSQQAIEFGENLLDFARSGESADLATAIRPYGAQLEEGGRVTIESVTEDGADWIKDDEAVALRGTIVATETWDDVTQPANLLAKAKQWLAEHKLAITSLELTAADLSKLDRNIGSYHVGDLVQVVSKPHNVNDYFQLAERTTDWLDPAGTKVGLGKASTSLVGLDVAGDRQSASNLDKVKQQATTDLKEFAGKLQGLENKVAGIDGTYFYIKYSQYANGQGMTDAPNDNTQYMGTCSTNQATAPTDPAKYTWCKVKGADGKDGKDGTAGTPGQAGADGKSQYFHVKYSNDGKTFTANNGETLGDWMGTCVTDTEVDPTSFSAYTWKKIVGEDGEPGIDGADGKDGQSAYFYVKFSANANGSPMTETPQSDTKYMGVCSSTSATAPTSPSAYDWTQCRGNDGANGTPGATGADGKTQYLHIKYSDDGKTFTGNMLSTDISGWESGYYTTSKKEQANAITSGLISIVNGTTYAIKYMPNYNVLVYCFSGENGETYRRVYGISSSGNEMTYLPDSDVTHIRLKYTSTETTATFATFEEAFASGDLVLYMYPDGVTRGEELGAYIGTLVDFTEADSTNFGDYTWKKFTEDVDEELDSIKQTVEERYTSAINTAEEIIFSALASYVETGNYEEFKKEVETQLEIMAGEITMNFTTTTEQITNVDGDLQTKFTQLYKFIQFSGDTAITIGSNSSAVTLEIDNEKGIVFKKNGVQLGLWNGENFYTGNIMVQVNERAQFGNFAFVPRSDGSLMFLKVGG